MAAPTFYEAAMTNIRPDPIATIDVKFLPPLKHLDPPGLHIGTGNHCYRIFNDKGSKLVFGTSRGTDRDRAVKRVQDVARSMGFTHYRWNDQDGDPLPLNP
jgi:hypothetical protein